MPLLEHLGLMCVDLIIHQKPLGKHGISRTPYPLEGSKVSILIKGLECPDLTLLAASVSFVCVYVRGDTVLCTAAIEGDRIVKAVST